MDREAVIHDSPLGTRRSIGVMARCLDQPDGLGLYAQHLLLKLLELDPLTRYVIFTQDRPACAALLERHAHAEIRPLGGGNRLVWDQVLVPLAARRARVDALLNPKFSVPLASGIPAAMVLQSSDWYSNPGNYPWWDRLYIRALMPLYCRRARRLFSISATTAAELAPHLPLANREIIVTGAGVAANFTPRRDDRELAAFRQRHALPERFILTLARVRHTGYAGGRSYPGANLVSLLGGYRHYAQAAHDPLPLVVVGAGVREWLAAQGTEPGLLRGVHFTGFIPNGELHAAYQLASGFLLATLCESFGLPILEAMSCGCPAIVPSTGAAPEVGGGAVRLVDPRDPLQIASALQVLLASPALCERLRRAGLERAREWSWELAARRVLAGLEALIPPARHAAPAMLAG